VAALHARSTVHNAHERHLTPLRHAGTSNYESEADEMKRKSGIDRESRFEALLDEPEHF
jgi:hypothetical protein